MPPKFNPDDPETVELISLFQTIGFSQAKATETAKNSKNALALKDIIVKSDLSSRKVDDKTGSLVAGLASQSTKLGDPEKQYVTEAILDGRLKSSEQVSGELISFKKQYHHLNLIVAAVKFVDANGVPEEASKFNDECGVGEIDVFAW